MSRLLLAKRGATLVEASPFDRICGIVGPISELHEHVRCRAIRAGGSVDVVKWLWVALGLAACGHLHFDPVPAATTTAVYILE